MFDSEEEIISRAMCSELPLETIQKAMQAIRDIESQKIKGKEKEEWEVVEIDGILYRSWSDKGGLMEDASIMWKR